MRSRLLDEDGDKRFVPVFDKGDEAVAGLTGLAHEHHLASGRFSGIGAFSQVTLGYFDRARKGYRKIEVGEQVEVLSLLGDVALAGGEPEIHAHVIVGKADGTAGGGHLLEARVWPTLEVILVGTPVSLRRRFDPETGLALLDPEPGPAAARKPA